MYNATLVRGSTYYLRATRFDLGKVGKVSQADKDHLDIHGVDIVSTSDGETIEKPKFKFVKIKATRAAPKKVALKAVIEDDEDELIEDEEDEEAEEAEEEPKAAKPKVTKRKR